VTKNRTGYLSLLPIFTLLIVIFWPGEHLINFEKLATRADGIRVEYRILFNLIPLFIILLLLQLIGYAKLIQPITETMAVKLLILVGLTFLAFFPAVNLNSQMFSFFSGIYRLIGIGHIGSGFADLAGVLEGASKVDAPGEYFRIDCPGTCVQYRWQYSRFLLQLPFENILSNSTQIIAVAMWLMIVLVSLLGFGNTFYTPLVLIGFLLPASLLAYERMNIENIIFLFIPLIVFFSRTKFKNVFIPFIIIFLTVIKFYPIVLALLFMILEKFKFRQVLIYGCTLAVGIILSIPDLNVIGRGNLVAGYAGSYGLPNFLSLLSGNANPYFTGIEYYWWVVGFVFCLLFVALGSRIQIDTSLIHSNQARLFLISSTLGISAWATNSNYMYRLILILWSLPLLIRLVKNNDYIASFALLCLFMGSSLIPISLSPVRNTLLAAFFCILIGICLKIISKQVETRVVSSSRVSKSQTGRQT
jgi:hypothetical protein